MSAMHGTVTEHVAADPDTLFQLVTDLDGLAQWNTHIDHVVEAADVLQPGSEWVVEMRALGTRWNSRAQLEELAPHERRFTYVSMTDDGNPSRARWTWNIAPDHGGSAVTVGWRLEPKTFWRKTLLAHIRHRQLRAEVRASIRAAAALVVSTNSA